MQKTGAVPAGQNAAPFFSGLWDSATTTTSSITASLIRSRPGTSAGEQQSQPPPSSPSSSSAVPPVPPVPPLPFDSESTSHQHRLNFLTKEKERRPSLSKKASFSRRRASLSSSSFASTFFFHHNGNIENGPAVVANAANSIPTPPASASTALSTTRSRSPLAEYTIPSPDISPRTTVPRPEPPEGPSQSQPPATPVSARPSTAAIPPLPSGNPYFRQQSSSNRMIGTTFGATYALPGSTNSSLAGPGPLPSTMSLGQPSEAVLILQHIQEVASKRISTLDYLRKAHEGRIYWFNTLRFDRPDLNRMSYFDARRLARRATNYLLLGLSLPAVVDFNSTSALELLRSLSALMAEFETYQQLHTESGSSSAASSLSRAARLPQMFRRANPGSKVRRTSNSTASGPPDTPIMPAMPIIPAMPVMPTMPSMPGSSNGFVIGSPEAGGGLPAFDGGNLALAGESGSSSGGLITSSSSNSTIAAAAAAAAAITASTAGSSPASTAFVTHYDNSADLLPGEEYALLLTPSLPFDPDFFETFATLCDVLIDCYTRILSLLPTPRECNSAVAEQFAKTDSRIRKLLVQNVVKEFEDHSRAGARVEVANVGKVVLGGLL